MLITISLQSKKDNGKSIYISTHYYSLSREKGSCNLITCY